MGNEQQNRGWRHVECPNGVVYWIPGRRDDEWDELCDCTPFVLPEWALSQVGVDDLLARAEAAEKRVGELEAKLPKTKDGVWLVEGMDLYYPDGSRAYSDICFAGETGDYYDPCAVTEADSLYSTRAAAEQALEGGE